MVASYGRGCAPWSREKGLWAIRSVFSSHSLSTVRSQARWKEHSGGALKAPPIFDHSVAYLRALKYLQGHQTERPKTEKEGNYGERRNNAFWASWSVVNATSLRLPAAFKKRLSFFKEKYLSCGLGYEWLKM